MQIDALLRNLHELSRGNTDLLPVVASALYNAIQTDSNDFLTELHSRIVLAEDPLLESAFDGLVDMFCAEPRVPATSPTQRQWRTFAVSTLLRYPQSFFVTKLGDVSSLNQAMAAAMNIDVEFVKCDPAVLPTWAAYDMSPADAFKVCESHRLWVEDMHDADPRDELVNPVVSNSAAIGVREGVLLVAVFCNETESARLVEALGDFAAAQPSFLVDATVGHSEFPIKLMLSDAGAPWTMFGEALHTAEMYHAASILRMLSVRLSKPVEDLALLAHEVDEVEGEGVSTRVSYLDRVSGELLAGAMFPNLYAPTVFMQKLNELLEVMQQFPVRWIDIPASVSAVQRPEDVTPRFYVPLTQSWELPPELY